MHIRERITILTDVKMAVLNRFITITEELLSRLEALGVNLDGYHNYKRNVPIKEENKVVEIPKQYSFKIDDNKKAA